MKLGLYEEIIFVSWIDLIYTNKMSQDVFSFEYHELIILSSRFQHANMVRQKCLDLLDLIAEGKTKQRPPTFEVPERELPCRFNVQPTTWFARDNVFNFILYKSFNRRDRSYLK